MQSYSNQVIMFFNNQLVLFTNGQRMIDAFIVQSGDILDSIIINIEITIYDKPVVQLLALLLEHDEVFEQLKK